MSTTSDSVTHFVVKIFRLSGMWTEWSILRFNCFFILGVLHVVGFFVIMDTWAYRNDIKEVTESLYTLILNFMLTNKVYFMLLSARRIESLTNILDAAYSRKHLSEELISAAARALRVSKTFFLFCVFTGLGFGTCPLIDFFFSGGLTPSVAFSNSTAEEKESFEKPWPMAFRVWTPWDQTKTPFYQLTYGFLLIHCGIAGTYLPAVDVLLATFIFLICGLLRVVNKRVRHLSQQFNTDQNIQEIEWNHGMNEIANKDMIGWGNEDGFLVEVMKTQWSSGVYDQKTSFERELGRVVREHHAIMEFVSRLNNIFSSMMMATFSWCLILICVISFQCLLMEPTSLEFAFKMSYAIAVIFEVFILCWSGEQLVEESFNIAEAVYSSPWYMAPPRIRRLLLTVLLRSQKSLQINVGKFAVLSIATFAQIMQSAYSYLAVLNELVE